MPRRLPILLFCLFGSAAPPHAGLTDRFVLPDDLEVTLWAESPQLFNPTNIDVDARGRVWVTEALNYRDFNRQQDHLHRPGGDRVVILEDTDGDGVSDSVKTFVQDPDLRAPLGIAVLGNRVVVSSSPHLIVYTDDDGDDRPDRKEILLTGFGGYDHDHGLHAVVAGPDGRWYLNTGNAGPHVVTDRAGWTLRSGSLYTGGTPYNLKNEGNRKSDDGRVWVGGLALRVNPDGSGLEVLAHNFRNAFELAVDSYGDLWQNDNDDQVMTCRTTWLMEGANAGYFSADGTRFWQADRRPGQSSFAAHWHQDDPGVLPAGDNTGAGSPTGVVVYESDALGPRYRGLLLSADAGRNVVFGYRPAPQGAGYALPRTDFLSSVGESTENYIWDADERDTRKWFRPSDVAVGTDGALYVADWYDPVVGGHRTNDGRGYGRIYRITPKHRRLDAPTLDLETTAGQIAALLSPAVNVRGQGFERLRAQGARVLPEVRRLLGSDNPYHRARAAWLMAALGPEGLAETERLLADPDPRLRIAAFRALRAAKPDVLPETARLARDPSPAARREAALALRGVPFAEARPVLLDLARGFDGEDRWYLEALGLAVEGHEEEAYALFREHFGAAGPVRWDPRFAALAWRLHPPSAVEALAARAGSPEVAADERARALTAIGFVRDEHAARAMAGLTRSDLPDVAASAAWWILYRKANDWREHALPEWTAVPVRAAGKQAAEMLPLRRLVLDPAARIDDRMEAAVELARDLSGGRQLIGLAAEGKLSYQVTEVVSAEIFGHPDPAVRALATAYFRRPGGGVALDDAAVAARTGTAERGAMLFASACASCHRMGATGGEVGPDLTEIRAKFDRGALLTQILHPAETVAFGYEPTYVSTPGGSVALGFVLGEGATLTVRDASGRMLSLPADSVAARLPLKGTVMPDPLALGLSEQDVADIAAFLMAPPSP